MGQISMKIIRLPGSVLGENQQTDNNDCPNMRIGGITPAQKLKMAA